MLTGEKAHRQGRFSSEHEEPPLQGRELLPKWDSTIPRSFFCQPTSSRFEIESFSHLTGVLTRCTGDLWGGCVLVKMNVEFRAMSLSLSLAMCLELTAGPTWGSFCQPFPDTTPSSPETLQAEPLAEGSTTPQASGEGWLLFFPFEQWSIFWEGDKI